MNQILCHYNLVGGATKRKLGAERD